LNGKTHAAATWLAALPAAAGLYYLTSQTPALQEHAPIVAAGALAATPLAVIVTPDLDQEGFSRSEYQLIKRFSIFGFAWLIYWYPYARAFKHRATGSHLPVLGTALRIAYAGIWPAVVWALLQLDVAWYYQAGAGLIIYYLLSSPIVFLGMPAGVIAEAAWFLTWPVWLQAAGLGAVGMLLAADTLHALLDLIDFS
jgi:uncharacterized metal-binding protein